jgi:hypothetical protein
MGKSLAAKVFTNKADQVTGERYCTSCHHHKPIEGGKWIAKLKSTQKRWICKPCYDTRKANVLPQK